MPWWMLCEDCMEPVEAERTHNGVVPCLHYVHCGWGHGPFDPGDGFHSPEAAKLDHTQRLLTRALPVLRAASEGRAEIIQAGRLAEEVARVVGEGS